MFSVYDEIVDIKRTDLEALKVASSRRHRNVILMSVYQIYKNYKKTTMLIGFFLLGLDSLHRPFLTIFSYICLLYL